MATRKRGGGHGSMSAQKYRKSMNRLRESVRAADAASHAAMNAKRSSMRKRVNAMNNGRNVRRSMRGCVASASMKSLRKKAAEHQQREAKKIAESYAKILRDLKAAEAAAKRASMDDLVAKTGAMKLNNGCAIMGGKRRKRRTHRKRTHRKHRN